MEELKERVTRIETTSKHTEKTLDHIAKSIDKLRDKAFEQTMHTNITLDAVARQANRVSGDYYSQKSVSDREFIESAREHHQDYYNREAAADRNWVRETRTTIKLVMDHARKVLVGVLATAGVYALWEGIQHYINRGN